MAKQGLILLVLGFISQDPLPDRVDVLELNHLYDLEGKHTVDQWIGWEFENGDLHVKWWCLAKRPLLLTRRGRDYSLILAEKNPRVIRAHLFYESWTQHDPEIADQKIFPKEQRKGLFQWLKK